jgi:NADPH:quinone reductase
MDPEGFSMRAQQVVALDGPAGLRLVDLPEPGAEGKVVIDVAAAGVAFPDLLISQGKYQVKPETPFVPGVEVAGTVRSAPRGSGLSAGDRVAAWTILGGFAEVVAAQPEAVWRVPDALDFNQAAGFIMNYHTVHFGLARRGQVRAGEVVAVHGAAGGVGTAAIQVARGLGATVIALVSSDEKAEVARRAGAEHVVDVAGPWKDDVRRLTGGRGADVILDPVGGDRFDESLRCLAPEGRLLVVGFTEGRIPSVTVNRLLLRNLAVVGVGWGAFLAGEPELFGRTSAALVTMIEAGFICPIVGRALPLEAAADALRLLEERSATGKLVLTMH